MNAVLFSLIVLFSLSLFRIHVVLALLLATVAGGWAGGLAFHHMLEVFSDGLKNNAPLALSYALLGAFAASLKETHIPDRLVQGITDIMKQQKRLHKLSPISQYYVVFAIVGCIACLSQNVIPIHIAFIPILIPPLLVLFHSLQVDRRAVACTLTFGLIAPYMVFPVGFGAIFHNTIANNVAHNGLFIEPTILPMAMLIPTIGITIGLIIATTYSYRKPRYYHQVTHQVTPLTNTTSTIRYPFTLWATFVAIGAMLFIQLLSGSMIYGATAGIMILIVARVLPWQRIDYILTDGMRSMASIGFIMMSASGFGAVLRATGHIEALVHTSVTAVGENKAIAALIMLIIGLLITLGIGSSFSTIPIIATIFVPLCIQLGFSPLATVALIGTAGALGDAGSPASDSTLGPTAGLNADGQHDHIWDTCVPTFLHYNVPLLIAGFIAALVL